MILIIDNYDSFVYNLERYVELAGMKTKTIRNDACTVEECLALKPQGVILSPGPKTPQEAGICLPLLKKLSPKVPLLGVCLGHQCLVEHFGGVTQRAIEPLHGEASAITHNSEYFFANLPNPMNVARYHSLISTISEIDDHLKIIAQSEKAEIMAVAHCSAPWFGVQFHPESILTPQGRDIINWFVTHCLSVSDHLNTNDNKNLQGDI